MTTTKFLTPAGFTQAEVDALVALKRLQVAKLAVAAGYYNEGTDKVEDES